MLLGCAAMAPTDDPEEPPAGRDHGEPGQRIERPAAHAGLGDALPPLRACSDARTPIESCRRPSEGGSGAAQTDASHGDILERLRAMQHAESDMGSPQRRWSTAEQRVRDCLEAFGAVEVEGEDLNEARASVQEVLEEGVSSTAVDGDGFTLLHYAAMYGCVEALASLVRGRANVNARTRVHETPLQLAAYYRHADACAILLAHRARADLADWQGRTPLAAAKASKCGGGPDNNSRAQGRCVELLEERAAKDKESGASKEADDLRQQGNAFFKKSNFTEAVAAYSLGLASWDDGLTYSNRAECYLKLERNMEAKMDAQKALGLLKGQEGTRKASWRLGKACLLLEELDRAAEAVSDGLADFPSDVSLRQLRVDVERARRARLGITR